MPTRMTLRNVKNVMRQSRMPALQVSGAGSSGIRVADSEGTLTTDSDVSKGAVVRH